MFHIIWISHDVITFNFKTYKLFLHLFKSFASISKNRQKIPFGNSRRRCTGNSTKILKLKCGDSGFKLCKAYLNIYTKLHRPLRYNHVLYLNKVVTQMETISSLLNKQTLLFKYRFDDIDEYKYPVHYCFSFWRNHPLQSRKIFSTSINDRRKIPITL